MVILCGSKVAVSGGCCCCDEEDDDPDVDCCGNNGGGVGDIMLLPLVPRMDDGMVCNLNIDNINAMERLYVCCGWIANRSSMVLLMERW